MKTIAMILLTLFPFLHEETYPVQAVCENNALRVQYENDWYEVTLFNVFLQEEEDICSYVNEGKRFEIAVDPLVKMETPLPVYLFVNGNLLQNTLIEKGIATTKINHPNYLYSFVEKTEERVMQEVEEETDSSHRSYNRYVAYLIIVAWSGVCVYLWFSKKKKRQKGKE